MNGSVRKAPSPRHATLTRFRTKLDLATRAGRYVAERPDLELLTPVSLGIVCFRVNPARPRLDEPALDTVNRAVLARVFREDHALISSTTHRDRFAPRLCVLNHTTTWDDVRLTLEAVERFGRHELSRERPACCAPRSCWRSSWASAAWSNRFPMPGSPPSW